MLIISIKSFTQSVSDSSLAYPFSNSQSGGLFLNIPSNIQSSVLYDSKTNKYILQQKIGSMDYGNPIIMDFFEYQKYMQDESVQQYWELRSNERSESQVSALGLPKLFVPGKAFDRVLVVAQ